MSSKRWQIRIVFGVLGLSLVSLAGINYVRNFCTAPIHLRLSGGEVCPLRSRMAKNICNEVNTAGIHLECMRGTNSEAICAAVDKGDLDLGLVLGGFTGNSFPNVRQVAVFGVDPLHLLVRPDLARSGMTTFDMLRGRRISLGEQGTNGSFLAESLMNFAGLRPTVPNQGGDYQAEHLRDRDLHLMLSSIRKASPESRPSFMAILPDAIFQVDSLPSPLADELVRVAGYQIVPLPYATALRLDNRRDRGHSESQLENSRLEPITIPAFTYGINPPTPAANCETLGLRLLLIANKNTSASAVLRVLRGLGSDIADRYHMNIEVANQVCEFPMHAGAAAFAKGRQPMILSDLVEPVSSFFSVAGAAAAGAFGVWGFFRGLRAVHPDVYLRKIARIERLARGDERDLQAPALPRDFIEYLEAQLAVVKQAAIDDYARRRLVGDEALVGILTLVADTRHLLTQRRRQLDHQDNQSSIVSGRRASAA